LSRTRLRHRATVLCACKCDFAPTQPAPLLCRSLNALSLCTCSQCPSDPRAGLPRGEPPLRRGASHVPRRTNCGGAARALDRLPLAGQGEPGSGLAVLARGMVRIARGPAPGIRRRPGLASACQRCAGPHVPGGSRNDRPGGGSMTRQSRRLWSPPGVRGRSPPAWAQRIAWQPRGIVRLRPTPSTHPTVAFTRERAPDVRPFREAQGLQRMVATRACPRFVPGERPRNLIPLTY